MPKDTDSNLNKVTLNSSACHEIKSYITHTHTTPLNLWKIAASKSNFLQITLQKTLWRLCKIKWIWFTFLSIFSAFIFIYKSFLKWLYCSEVHFLIVFLIIIPYIREVHSSLLATVHYKGFRQNSSLKKSKTDNRLLYITAIGICLSCLWWMFI